MNMKALAIKYLFLVITILSISACSETENGVLENSQETPGGIISVNSDGGYTLVSSMSTGDSESWSVSQITATDSENIKFTNIGTFRSSGEVQDVVNSLPIGFYEIEVVVTNSGESVTDRTLFIAGYDSEIQPRIAHKVSKYALKKIINSVDRGAIGSFIRNYLPSSVSSKMDRYVLPELRKLLKWDRVFRGNVENAISDGLIKAGAAPWLARRIATLVGVLF